MFSSPPRSAEPGGEADRSGQPGGRERLSARTTARRLLRTLIREREVPSRFGMSETKAPHPSRRLRKMRRAAFPREPSELEEYLCEDGIHPSRLGQGLIFRTLARQAEKAYG